MQCTTLLPDLTGKETKKAGRKYNNIVSFLYDYRMKSGRELEMTIIFFPQRTLVYLQNALCLMWLWLNVLVNGRLVV